MKNDVPVMTKLSDYSPYGFVVSRVALDFDLYVGATVVQSKLEITRDLSLNKKVRDLVLDGEDIKLVSVKIDDKSVAKLQLKKTKTTLTIKDVPDNFTLEIVTECSPKDNKALMGLYVSGGRFCTQCEAQGFRRITYFPDRPDVLSVYTVRMAADKAAFPTLLANGNKIDSGDLDGGRHFALWEDPFPKPSYLFALVAGTFDSISDKFTTMSGRDVRLDIFVDPGDTPRAHFAMDALIRSMAWDEQAFGREYDLDRFMVVAVRDFNFGAMENKGLNIFNSALLLADEATATDMNFERIESVVAHEYFHNWSGNRVTCRDWFQLCLKEGFTVFRDQEFSASQRGAALQRIKDVIALRSRQFPEDAGPLAHPVRPNKYLKIDNFYTATVYEKGAELVRMLKILMGEELFRKGSDLYFDSLDGTAATIEQFIACFEQVSQQDLTQFLRWYEQAGTPTVKIDTDYDQSTKIFRATFTQSLEIKGKKSKPMMIPIEMALVTPDGRNFGHRTLVLCEKSTTIEFENVPEQPTLSAFRGFSAPVNVQQKLSLNDTLLLMRADDDLFNRWEAGQSLARSILSGLTQCIETGTPPQNATAMRGYVDAIGHIINDPDIDPGFKSLALGLPSDGSILQLLSNTSSDGTDPLAVRQAQKMLRRAIAETHAPVLLSTYRNLSEPKAFTPSAADANRRGLRNACLSLLADIPGKRGQIHALSQFENATNMTEEIVALAVLVRLGGKRAPESLAKFYEKWKSNALVIDKWFAVAAQQGLTQVQALTKHADFQSGNPNRVRALIGGFAISNPEQFHQFDGKGYEFYADNVLAMDKRNPQVAARLLGAFESWRKLDINRQGQIRAQLNRILAAKPSDNVVEIAAKTLGKF